MALNLYTGQPGAGKSYNVVAHVIIPALKKDRHVVTNIPLEVDLLEQVFGGRITQLELDALDDPDLPSLVPNGCVAVIDECWNRWPSGQRISKAPSDDLHWLKEHRHRVDDKRNAMQVVLCTQDPADLAAWVRNLIKHTFWMEKLDTVGADNSYSVKVYKGCPTGQNIPKRLLIRTTYGKYDPDIYQYYRSATQSDTDDVGDEKAMDKRSSIWSSPGFLAQMILPPILFVGSCWYMYHVYQQYQQADEPKPAKADVVAVVPGSESKGAVNPLPPSLAAAPVAVPAAEPAPVVETLGELPASVTWRVVGYMMRSAEKPSEQWRSKTGYGDVPEPETRLNGREDLVILKSIAGQRYVPLSSCRPFPDGFNYSCDVDGERVTPWSGQMGVTQTIPGSAVSGARDVSIERSGIETSRTPPAHSSSQPPSSVSQVQPQQTGTRVTGIPYTPAPRTLL